MSGASFGNRIDRPVFRPGVTGLTHREREVLHWIAMGKRNGEIACILGVSAATVKRHCENIYAKLGVETRTAAAAWRERE